MAMIVLSSPSTLTGSDEKKTGPSRFTVDFQNGAVILKQGIAFTLFSPTGAEATMVFDYKKRASPEGRP